MGNKIMFLNISYIYIFYSVLDLLLIILIDVKEIHSRS